MHMIDTVQKGFLAVQRAGASKLGDTLDALVAAGLDITSAFNSKMGTVFDRAHTVRHFGPLLFQAPVGPVSRQSSGLGGRAARCRRAERHSNARNRRSTCHERHPATAGGGEF